ncbi:MAG: cation:proton antiporter [Acidobacteria bacterium]|nr:cation:proton antiporter [Acidobacteriota bacterium]
MPRPALALLLALLALLPAPALAGGPASHTVIGNIALCMVGASVLAYLMKLGRQPLILGYLLAGVLIGPVGFGLITDETEIVTVSSIGLILLLFMIGLEIDLKRMFASGRLVVVAGILQFPVCVAAAYGLFSLGARLGLPLPMGFDAFYAALACGISSTMIVVKLLHDKRELDSLPGRLTIGILIFQDIWAIVVLAVQPNFAQPEVFGILKTFGAGGLLVLFALLLARYVLPHVFHTVAKVPELLLVLSLGWCFLVCLVAAHPKVGLSMEMGALIAGISLATFPYNLDVIAKVLTIRDFFITLFFVTLGMQIPRPSVDVTIVALAIALVALLVRLVGVLGLLKALGATHRIAALATVNLAQMSEFALVILALGVTFGHIPKETLTVVTWSFAILAVLSTYLIAWSHPLQSALSRALASLGWKEKEHGAEEPKAAGERTIVVLGFFRTASALVDEIARNHQHLLSQITVIDFNPAVKKPLEDLGIRYVYGDIGTPATLEHADISHAKVVLSTVTDSFLKGTTNLRLLQLMRELCPKAEIVVSAQGPDQSKELYAAGADFVLNAPALAGESLASVLEQAMSESLEGMRVEARQRLLEKREVLA